MPRKHSLRARLFALTATLALSACSPETGPFGVKEGQRVTVYTSTGRWQGKVSSWTSDSLTIRAQRAVTLPLTKIERIE